MIRRSPCEYYLKFLLIHPDKYTNDRIKAVIRRQQLDWIGEEYLEDLRATCVPPEPFRPNDPTHTKSQRFLIAEGLRYLFHTDQHMKVAQLILQRPKAKEFAESMLLSGAPTSAIAYALNQKGLKATAEGVTRYRHYFFNVDLLDSTEMRAAILLRSDPVAQGVDMHDPESAARASAVKKAAWSDPRKVASELPSTPMAALIAQIKLGIMPNNLDVARVLESARAVASLRALELATNGEARDADKRAINYMMVARIATEVLEQVVKPDEVMRQQLSSILLQTEQQPVPSIKELSAGNHTVDMEMREKEEEEYEGDGRKDNAG